MRMTEVKDSITGKNDHDLKVLIVPEGRKLYFIKECLDAVTIHRKVDDGEWTIISKNTRTPYIDDEQFNPPVVLAYKAIFEKQRLYENIVKVHLS